MKLLLTSAGISNKSIHHALTELLGKPVGEASALFVPTAIYGIRNGGEIVRGVINGTLGDPFVELGWKSIGLLDPLLDKFNDIREVDAIIDGNEPWCTDWQMPYSFGAQFYEKRLVIAKLAGNPRFEELVDFTYTTIERLSAESGSPFTYDRNNYSMPIPAIVRALSDVRPLN